MNNRERELQGYVDQLNDLRTFAEKVATDTERLMDAGKVGHDPNRLADAQAVAAYLKAQRDRYIVQLYDAQPKAYPIEGVKKA